MQNQQSVYFKEDFTWHYVSLYLDSLTQIVPIKDEKFNKLFQKVKDYVETKVFTVDEGEFVDMFVVIERKPNRG